MAAVSFTPPRQWEDWVSWILGFWLLLSPWALGFAAETRAMENTVLVGFALILAEGVTLTVFEVWEEWINLALGAWLCAAPWVLGYVGTAATVNSVLVGVLVIALSAYEMRQVGRERDGDRVR